MSELSISDFYSCSLISRYDPGDVVVIHPVASFTDVQTFLRVMGWEDIADAPFSVEQRMFGTFLLPLR